MNRILYYLVLVASALRAYDLPLLNIGLTNILDGGPIRPTYGWYYYILNQYYSNATYTDSCGNILGNAPYIPGWEDYAIIEAVYQTERDVLFNAQGGIDILFPFALGSSVCPNNQLGITDSGGGPSDFFLGIFLQWHPVTLFNTCMFVHRAEFAVSFPTGKYIPCFFFNPGNGVYFLNPYWAATLFITPQWAASWRLQYIWAAANKYTNTQAGQAIVLNYSMEYEIIPSFWVALNGYLVEQYTDAKANGVSIPGSRERVLGIGPGCLYSYHDNIYVLAHAYWEVLARNRPQGFNFVAEVVLHFGQ